MAALDLGYRLLNSIELERAQEYLRLGNAKTIDAARKLGLKPNPRIAEANLR